MGNLKTSYISGINFSLKHGLANTKLGEKAGKAWEGMTVKRALSMPSGISAYKNLQKQLQSKGETELAALWINDKAIVDTLSKHFKKYK